MRLEPNDPRHGSFYAYNELRCRCDQCRAAARAHRAPKRAAQRQRARAARAAAGQTPNLNLRIVDLEAES